VCNSRRILDATIEIGQKGMAQFDLRALVVNDNLSDRGSLVAALRKVGFVCEEAGDGEDALEKANSTEFDVVVTGLRIPKMHGHRLSIELLQLNHRPRVIVLTAITDSRILQDLLCRGVDDVLLKTLGDSEFVAAKVSFLIHKQRLEASRHTSASSPSAAIAGQRSGNGDTPGKESDAHENVAPIDSELTENFDRHDDDHEKMRWSKREENGDEIGVVVFDGEKRIPPARAFIKATTRDISATGIGFYCARRFETTQSLILKLGELDSPEYFLAEVVHCEERDDKFAIGCRFSGLCNKWEQPQTAEIAASS